MAKGEDNPIKYAVISATTGNGNNTILSPTKRVRVLGYVLTATAGCSVRFESGAGGTALTGIIPLPANGGVSAAGHYIGWFETETDADVLNLEISNNAAADVYGHLSYQEFEEVTT